MVRQGSSGFHIPGNHRPNDRYKTFKGPQALRRFLRYKTPFAAYISVAFYENPRKRGGWEKAEYIFDIDAKDLPIRSCGCDSVCEICLGEALERVNIMLDTLQGDLGIKNIHLIYSGRGFHIRILDPVMMEADSDLRSEVLKYVAGAVVPKSQYPNKDVGGKPYNFEHFSIPIAYPRVFTEKVKYNVLHLRGDEQIDGINPRLLKDLVKNSDFLLHGSCHGQCQSGHHRCKGYHRFEENFKTSKLPAFKGQHEMHGG